MYIKLVEGNAITGKQQMQNRIPTDEHIVEITEQKYKELESVMQTRPQDTLETVWYLSNETEQWESRERSHEEIIQWYVDKITAKEITLEDVPEELRVEVEEALPQPEATEADYQAALGEMGVTFNEEENA